MCYIFWNLCGSPPGLEGRCDEDFLKEKGQITRFPKDAAPQLFFSYTKISSVFHLVFFPKRRVAHNDVYRINKTKSLDEKDQKFTKTLVIFCNVYMTT